MECQGTVKPSDVTTEVSFDIKRDIWARAWAKPEDSNDWAGPDPNRVPWDPDDDYDDDEDLSPSPADHIYQIDGVGIKEKARIISLECIAYIADFREWVMIYIDYEWYQCSDYYKWHSQIYTKPKNDDYITRDALSLQKLGADWITVPENP